MKKIAVNKPLIKIYNLPNIFCNDTVKILNYFYPEFIISLILYFFINYLDGFFISRIQTSCYATLGVTNTLFHLITKIGEGFSVAIVILIGQFNGSNEFKQAGDSFKDGFWLTCIIGALISLTLYFGAFLIYYIFNIPSHMLEIAVPYLRLRAAGVFFSFLFFALIGFLRGIKNTKIPMYIFLFGALIFVFFDYALIFGKFGFAKFGFQGSAYASIIQYIVMFSIALTYILYDSELRKYSIKIFSKIDFHNISHLLKLSWPVMVDKASFALCYIWLGSRISCMVNCSNNQSCEMILSTFSVIKDLSSFAILPGIALAQVVTFLVSNDFKSKNYQGIKDNIKRSIIISSVFVYSLLFLICTFPKFFITLVDKKGIFTDFASGIIPIISLLVLFDLIQVILAAGLRGAADVKTVMWVRILINGLFFVPLSYLISVLPITNLFVKFSLVYGSFYISNLLMSLIYIYRFRSGIWKRDNS